MTQSLIPFNRKMGFLHLIQGTAILVLALTVDTFKAFRPTIFVRFLEPYGS